MSARDVSLDNFVRLKIAPRILDAVARKRNDIDSVAIYTEEFDWRSVRRKLIDDERSILSLKDIKFWRVGVIVSSDVRLRR